MVMDETSPNDQPAETPKNNHAAKPEKLVHRRIPNLSRKKLLIISGIAILILAGVITLLVLRSNKSASTSAPSASANTTANAKSLFGTMVAFNISDAINGTPGKVNALQNGWTEFKKDNSAYQNLLANLQKVIEDHTKLVKTTGFTLDRGSFGYFTWNVIEPQKGQFDWGLTDLDAKGVANAGEKISAVIQPFAGWDQKNTQVNTNCSMLDAAYYDYKAGAPNDLIEYENFLTKTVERYKDNVAVWEIGNEPDANCSGYENNPEAYFNLLKISSVAIKEVDPSAKVVNGGASGHSNNSKEISFWTNFFALGGGHYIDYFNLHYNTERSHDAKLDTATFQEDLTFWNNLMDKNGGKKPLYLTEFGIYSGSPSDLLAGQLLQGQSSTANQPVSAPSSTGQNQNNPITLNQGAQTPSALSTSQNLPEDSQSAQATLYFKDSVLAFANGADFVFIDLIGPDGDLVGSSMAFNTDNQPRLFLTTLRTINQKLVGFSNAEKIADGQYRFTVGDKTVYDLWTGTLPPEISGKVKMTDITGQEQLMDATKIKLSVDQPVIVNLQN